MANLAYHISRSRLSLILYEKDYKNDFVRKYKKKCSYSSFLIVLPMLIAFSCKSVCSSQTRMEYTYSRFAYLP